MARVTKSREVDVAENGRPSLKGEDADTLRDYYYQMLLIRRFEERTSEMYTKAKIGGYCHLNLGEEATIIGLMAVLHVVTLGVLMAAFPSTVRPCSDPSTSATS